MKRITSACLLETIRFNTTNSVTSNLTAEQEFEAYCRRMERKKIKYKIEDVKSEPDGSVVARVRKQYNAYPTEDYIN